MTIDERLERLTERHEALTESVEGLLLAQREHEASMVRRAGEVFDAISRLERIAAQHEQRLDDLEHPEVK